jgi:hypothetical protein
MDRIIGGEPYFYQGKELMCRESSSSKRGREAFSKGDIVRRMEEDRERVCLLSFSFFTSPISV